jgi:hypothetical protein
MKNRISAPHRLLEAQKAAVGTRKLHQRLPIHRTFDAEQVDLNEKAPTRRTLTLLERAL